MDIPKFQNMFLDVKYFWKRLKFGKPADCLAFWWKLEKTLVYFIFEQTISKAHDFWIWGEIQKNMFFQVWWNLVTIFETLHWLFCILNEIHQKIMCFFKKFTPKLWGVLGFTNIPPKTPVRTWEDLSVFLNFGGNYCKTPRFSEFGVKIKKNRFF